MAKRGYSLGYSLVDIVIQSTFGEFSLIGSCEYVWHNSFSQNVDKFLGCTKTTKSDILVQALVNKCLTVVGIYSLGSRI